jgi:hypothetical protein
VRPERRTESGKALHRGVGSRWFVDGGEAPALLRTPRRDGYEVALDHAVGVRLGELALAGGRERVRAITVQLRVAIVQVLGGLAHHERRGVDQPLREDAGIRVDAFAHRMVSHVLDSTGDRDVVRTERDAGRGGRDGGHRSRAHPVDRITRHGTRQAGQQRGGPADCQSLIARLGRRGDRDVVHPVGRELRVAAKQLADALDHEVVGAGLGVHAAGLAERGADAVDEDDVAELSGHGPSSVPTNGGQESCSVRRPLSCRQVLGPPPMLLAGN